MLLSLYKTNQPLVLLFLPIVAVLFWAPNFSSELIEIKNTTPVFDFFVTSSIFLNKSIGILIVIATALLLNITINKNEFFHQNYYIPSLVYVAIMSSLPELNTLHPILIANFFVVLTFRRLINIHSQVSCKSEVFDASLFLLVSGLFYPPSCLFLLVIWVTLMIFRPFNWKEWIAPFLALGLFLIYFFASLLFTPKTSFYTLNSLIDSSVYDAYSYSVVTYILSFLIFLITILGFYQIHKKRKSSSIRFKKMTNTVLAITITSIVLFGSVFYYNKNLEAIMFSILPVCIAITYFLVYFKNKIVTEISLALLIGLILLNNYL